MSTRHFPHRDNELFDHLAERDAYTSRETLLGQLLVMALILLGILLSSV